MGLFEKMLDIERRKEFLAYRESKHNDEAMLQKMREYLLSGDFEDDVRRISEGDYRISVPVKKEIPKRYTDRKRTVYHCNADEMTLFRMMSFVLHDYADIMPDEIYSFRKGIGAKDLILRISRNTALREMYVVKADIRSYGNSIDAERLIEILQESFADREPEAVSFFSWLLRRKVFISDGVLTEGDTSALPGIPIHNFFTNIYLADTDRRIAPRCEFYARYSDDIIMFQRSKEDAESNMGLLLDEFTAHRLMPHQDDKTGIYDPGQPYDYLGFTFDNGRIDIASASLKKLKRKMRIRTKRIAMDKKMLCNTREEKAKQLIHLNRQTFFGRKNSSELCWNRWAFPVITKTDALHELDLYNQRCIRYILSGKWSDAQYRIRYQELKNLGYESLVRAYYDYMEKAES